MSDLSKVKRIVVDESILANLLGDISPASPEEPAPPAPKAVKRESKAAMPKKDAAAPALFTSVSRTAMRRTVVAAGEHEPAAAQSAKAQSGSQPVASKAPPPTPSSKPRASSPPPRTEPTPAKPSKHFAASTDGPAKHHAVATALFLNGEFEKAADGYREVIRRDGRSWPARFNLGLCLERLGRREEAAAAFRGHPPGSGKSGGIHWSGRLSSPYESTGRSD